MSSELPRLREEEIERAERRLELLAAFAGGVLTGITALVVAVLMF